MLGEDHPSSLEALYYLALSYIRNNKKSKSLELISIAY